MSDTDELWTELGEIYRLPYEEQWPLLEGVAPRILASGDDELIFMLAGMQSDALIHGDEPDATQMLAPFARQLGYLDRQPEWLTPRRVHSALWRFKSAVHTAAEDPRISRAQVEELLGSMRDYYRRFNAGPAAVAMTAFRVRRALDGAAAADEDFRAWTSLPRDEYSDCAGCEPTTRVSQHTDMGRVDEAVATFREGMRTYGDCVAQPQTLVAHGLIPLLQAGDVEEAAQAHLLGLRISRDKPRDAYLCALHVEALTRSGHPERALELIEHRAGLEIPLLDRLMWAAACARTYRELQDQGYDGPVRLAEREVDLATARREAEQTVQDWCRRFDERNGNDHLSQEMQATLAGGPLPRMPLPAAAPAVARPAVPEVTLTSPRDALDQLDAAGIVEDELTEFALSRAWAVWDGPVADDDLATVVELDQRAAATLLDWAFDPAKVERLVTRAVEGAQRLGDPAHRMRSELTEAYVHGVKVKLGDEFYERARRVAADAPLPLAHRIWSGVGSDADDDDTRAAVAEEILALPIETPMQALGRVAALLHRAMLRDDVASAREAARLAADHGLAIGADAAVAAAHIELVADDTAAAERDTQAALEAAQSLRWPRLWVQCLHLLLEWAQRGSEQWQQQADWMVEQLAAVRHPVYLKDAMMFRSMSLLIQGRMLEAVDLAERGLEVRPRLMRAADVASQADTDLRLHWVAAHAADNLHETIVAAHHAAAVIAGDEGDEPGTLGTMHLMVGNGAREQGDHAAARQAFEAAWHESLTMDDVQTAGVAIQSLARIGDEAPEARVAFITGLVEAATATCSGEAEQWYRTVSASALADRVGDDGDHRRAVELFRRSADGFREMGRVDSQVSELTRLADAQAAAELDPEPTYREALDLATRESPAERPAVAGHYCNWMFEQGREQEADRLWEEVTGQSPSA